MRPTGRRLRVAAFLFDGTEAAQVRRVRSYLASGFDVTGFAFRRDNMNGGFVPEWTTIDLGRAVNESPLRRLAAIARGIARTLRHRAVLGAADVIVARNLDLLLIALASRATVPAPRPPVVYECLDIHGLMTAPGVAGRAMRWLERRCLRHVALLIVSSPGFIDHHFGPVQGWNGDTALVENKLWLEGATVVRPRAAAVARRHGPIRLGWVGTLRCPRSLALLAEAAARMGPAVRVEMWGVVHHHALPDFDAVLGGLPNMTYHGPYDYPDGLAAVYEFCDAVWTQDLWQWGANSTWLLPNRIYEASYFGCPSIAVAGTQTGDRVADGLGWTIPAPHADALVALLRDLDADALTAKRVALLERPDAAFRQDPCEIGGILRRAMGRGAAARAA